MDTSCSIKNLTHEALSKFHLDRCSSAALIRSFVASQAQHASAYAIEGKKIASRWNSGPGSEIRSSISAAAVDTKTNTLGGGFSSPILKPRNPKCTTESQSYLQTSLAEHATGNNGSSKMLLNVEERKKDDSAPDKTVKKQSKNPKQGTRELKEKERISKRNRSDSDDERNERNERLKQRRIRRQNKKEITTTTPKVCTEETSIASGDEADEPKSFKRKSKLPAGLALMHGFSAGNIGKHRLTVGPVATFGVFNKGRASAKTKTGKKSKCKALSTFNEIGFLNKPAPRGVSKTVPKRSRAMHSDCSSTPPFEEGQSTRRQRHTPETKKGSSPATREMTSSSTSSQQRLDGDVKSNCESEVWEIEKEFLQDTNSTTRLDAVTVQELESIVKPCSVVINSKLWGWTIPEEDGQAESAYEISATDRQTVTKKKSGTLKAALGSQIGSLTSLAPSQSASQIPARPSDSSPPPPLTSKFFPMSKDDKRSDGEAPSVIERRSVSPPCKQSTPFVCDMTEGKTESPLISCDRKLDTYITANLQEDPQLQSLKNGRGSAEVSACSIEGAIRRLEAEDSSLRSPTWWIDVQSSPVQVSALNAESIPEDQLKATLADDIDPHSFQLYYDYSNPCNHGTLSDEAFTEYSYSKNNLDMHSENSFTHAIYEQLPAEAEPDAEIYEQTDFQDENFDSGENAYPIDYESVVDDHTFGHYDTYQLTEHESEIEDTGCTYTLRELDRSSESVQQSHMSIDDFSEISGVHEQQINCLEEGAMTKNFVQGRYMLYGPDCLQDIHGLGVQESNRITNPLADAEASVVREMQNSWYPVKF